MRRIARSGLEPEITDPESVVLPITPRASVKIYEIASSALIFLKLVLGRNDNKLFAPCNDILSII